MKNILFTGGRSPVTLDLIRLFAKSGYNAYVAESFKSNMSGASKHVKKNIIIPAPATDTEEFIQGLIDTIMEYKIDLLIPTCEEVFYISRYIKRLEKYCRIFTSGIDVLDELHSKYKFIGLLNKLEIAAPESQRLFSLEELKNELKQKDKFVLKPEYSRFASNVVINDKSPEKINSIKISEDYPWVLQQYIKGDAFCSYTVAQNGKILAHTVYPSKYIAGQGATMHFEAVEVPEIYEIVEKIVKHYNFTGQISFDIIRSHENGLYYPIECNPRATSGLYLFAEDLTQAFHENPNLTEVIKSPANKQKMVGLAMLIYGLPYVKKGDDRKEFAKKFYNAKDVVFKFNDLKPFLSQFSSLTHYSNVAKKNNVTLTEAMVLDIEWNGK